MATAFSPAIILVTEKTDSYAKSFALMGMMGPTSIDSPIPQLD